MICPDCKGLQKTEMILRSTIYSWKDGVPTFCLEDWSCPKCEAEIGTRFYIDTYKKGDKADAQDIL